MNEDHFLNTCRTCMSKSQNAPGTNPLDSIYHHKNLGAVSIQELLNSVIHELPKIEAEDELPKIICNSCLEKLILCEEFQQMCLRSDSEFRSSLNSDPLSETNVKEDKFSVSKNIEELLGREDQFVGSIESATEGREETKSSMKCEKDDDDDGADANENFGNQIESKEGIQKKFDGEHESVEAFPPVEEEPIICDKCHKIYKSRQSLRKHISNFHAESTTRTTESENNAKGPFSCTECSRKFAKSSYLRKHKITHARDLKRQRKCSCGLSFRNLILLSQHQLSHLQENDESASKSAENPPIDPMKPCICEICKKAFRYPWTLRDHHIRVHTDQQAFLCSECGKGFNTSSNLQQHILRHGGEKRYECPECPKKFPCLSDLSSHKKVHKKARPHVCDLCGAAFGRPYHLKKHKMHHTGTKNYKCEQCEKRFVTGDHMRRHMRTHTGEKPYKCQYCEKAFMQSNDLMKHLRLHLGENVYRCELCPKRFPFAGVLREHLTEHKKEDPSIREQNRLALIEEEEKLRILIEQKKQGKA